MQAMRTMQTMRTQINRLTPPPAPIESLESRTLLSAAPVAVPAATSVPRTSTTTLTVSTPSALLGQSVKATVVVKASKGGGPVAGSVEFFDNGTPIVTANTPLTVKLHGGKATYSFGAGDVALFTGSHQLTAEFFSTNKLPNSLSAPAAVTISAPTFATQADGLGIASVTAGRGAGIKSGQNVKVLYTGFLASNGTIFDYATANHGPGSKKFLPFKVGTGSVIQGFDEGTVGIKKGETRVLQIPSALGYGAQGAGSSIPANADLFFLVTRI